MKRHAIAFLLFGLLGSFPMIGHGAEALPTIKVAIGMTPEQLRAGSTYPVESGQMATAPTTADPGLPALNNWLINGSYDLHFSYREHVLVEKNLGGSRFLIAITTNPFGGGVVDFVQVTCQNHVLTLGEAITEAKKLERWFVGAGFHLPGASDPDAKDFEQFAVEDVARSSRNPKKRIANYEQLADAFADPELKIITASTFNLVTDDVTAGLTIENARRQRNEFADKDVAGDPKTEREYFVNLYIRTRHLQLRLPRSH